MRNPPRDWDRLRSPFMVLDNEWTRLVGWFGGGWREEFR